MFLQSLLWILFSTRVSREEKLPVEFATGDGDNMVVGEGSVDVITIDPVGELVVVDSIKLLSSIKAVMSQAVEHTAPVLDVNIDGCMVSATSQGEINLKEELNCKVKVKPLLLSWRPWCLLPVLDQGWRCPLMNILWSMLGGLL